MLNRPVFTTIRNLTNKGFNLSWLPKAQKWVEAGEAIDVDYEPWSCANDKQRVEIAAELRSHRVSFTLTIYTTAGRYESIPYDPSALSTAKATAKPVRKAEVKMDTSKQQSDHIVIAGSDNVESLGLGLQVSVPKPKESEHLGEAKTDAYGFSEAAPEPTENSVVAGEGAEEAQAKPADGELEAEFDQLVADKKWNDALELLKKTYGDKVTFGIRAIIAAKSFAAIVAKYKLDK